MKPFQQAASVLFAALGAFLIREGVVLRLEGDFGPGPGFMAFVVGCLMLACAVLWGVRVSFAATTPMPDNSLPDRAGLVKVLAIVGALMALAAILPLVGFRIAIFLFLLVAQFVFGRDHRILKVAVAALCSFGLATLFEKVLRVPVPAASIDALAALGF